MLAQLSNKVQHALRAYTPAEQKAIKAAAESFRVNPDFDTATAMTELATGEALVSFLDAEGTPAVVQRARVIAPGCSMGAAPADDQTYLTQNSPYATKYGTPVDRESAYELLNAATIAAAKAQAEADAAAAQAKADAAAAAEQARAEAAAEKEAQRAAEREAREQARAEAAAAREAQREAERQAREAQKQAEREAREAQKEAERQAREAQRAAEKAAAEQKKEAERRQRRLESIGTSVARTAATTITRGILGSIKKGLF